MQEHGVLGGSSGGDLTGQHTQQQHHDEGRKQSAGSNPAEEQELKAGQSSSLGPSKDEQAASKPGHKTKKIKNSKVVEYTGSAKKGGGVQQTDAHSIQDYSQQNMQAYQQQQNASIQVLSQSPLADQARVQSTKQSERDEQTSQLGHAHDSGKQSYPPESASTASQVQPQKKKK